MKRRVPPVEPSAEDPLGSKPPTLASAEFAHVVGGAAMPSLEVTRAMRSLAGRMFNRPSEPTCVGRYEIVRWIGSGGMGVVYEAHDPELRRHVALKVVHGDGMATGERLLREARAMAKLEHPEIVRVFDAGTHQGDVYLTMELVRGTNLRQWLALAPRPRSDVLRVFAACARALAAVHEAGLVHRDFKPENVLIAADGRVRVGDFGLVRDPDDAAGSLTKGSLTTTTWSGRARAKAPAGAMPSVFTGTVFGTPAYMSPEHHRGMKVDAWSDQYAFGVALYEACCGYLPFAGKSAGELFDDKTSSTLEFDRSRQPIPRWLRRTLARCLEPHAKSRYPNMLAVATELTTDRTRPDDTC